MTDKPKPTPQAFPNHFGYGMTLLDYYAGQALNGLPRDMSASDQAFRAYEVARAMLKERNK